MRSRACKKELQVALLGSLIAVVGLLSACGEDEPVPITFNIGGETVEPTPLLSYTLEPEAPPTLEPADG